MKEVRKKVTRSRPMSLDLPKVNFPGVKKEKNGINYVNIHCTCGNSVALENGWGYCENCALYLRYNTTEKILDVYELVEFVKGWNHDR